MKKVQKLLIILIIIEGLLLVWDGQNKNYLASLIGVNNSKELKMLKVSKPYQRDAPHLYYIGFLISKDTYQKYSLSYKDTQEGQSLYDGRIENKKQEYSENTYHCLFKSEVSDASTRRDLSNCILIRNLLIMNAGIVVIVAFTYLLKAFRKVSQKIPVPKEEENEENDNIP